METSSIEYLNFHDIERSALALREELGYEDTPLNVFKMLQELGVMVQWSSNIPSTPHDLTVKDWSGVGTVLRDGRLLIVLNSAATPERQHVTALEEFFHHHYGHTPVLIDSNGRSDYHADEEETAYQTAAACLLPARQVALAVFSREDPVSFAQHFGASVELFEMRVKRLNFWSHYHAAKARRAA